MRRAGRTSTSDRLAGRCRKGLREPLLTRWRRANLANRISRFLYDPAGYRCLEQTVVPLLQACSNGPPRNVVQSYAKTR